jgi:hypothetical protein
VPAVPTAELARRPLDDDDTRAGFARGERGAQGGVSSAKDDDVVLWNLHQCSMLNAQCSR